MVGSKGNGKRLPTGKELRGAEVRESPDSELNHFQIVR